MIRLFLTFLALLTGLAAEVSPAQAALRRAGEAEVGTIQQFVAAARKSADIVELAMAVEAPGGEARRLVEPLLAPPVPVPAYIVGVDRARE